MGLETGTYLNDLNTANPDGATDAKSDGDNHIRLIKSTLKATFPGMAGAAWRVQTKAADYTLAATDNMSQINVTAAATITGVAATLGNQFIVLIYNAHSAAITIPSYTLPAGSAVLMTCNGSAFHHFPFAVGNPTVTSLTTTGAVTAGNTLTVSAGNLGVSAGTITASGNITSTGGAIQTSANYINATKNSQTNYSSAGLQSTSTSGNASLGLHTSGATAAYIEHTRGGNGIQVRDASNAYANVYCSNLFADSEVFVGTYEKFTTDASFTDLYFDNQDFIRYTKSSNTYQFVVGNVGYPILSASGIYPTTDNTLGCGVATNRWSVVYSTNGTIQTSDKRRKEDLGPLGDVGPIIDSLQPVAFRWKASGEKDVGFYAQDVAPLIPEAVTEGDDAIDWGMKPDRLIPFLVREIQSLRRRVAELESR